MRAYSLALAACVVGSLVYGLLWLDMGPCDDDYIVYRYAENLVEGRGLVYNEERIEGYTAPLWMFLMALVVTLGGRPDVWSPLLSLIATAGCVLGVGIVWKRWCPRGRLPLPSVLVALCPVLHINAARGLGTTLLAALLVGWLVRYDEDLRARRPGTGAALWIGLASLLRHEALLLMLPFLWNERRRGYGSPVWLALSPLVGWSLFRWFYYGELLPVTYHIKKLGVLDDLAYGLRYLILSNLESGLLILLAFTWPCWIRKGNALSLRRVTLFGILLHTSYVIAVGGDYMSFARFFAPTLPLVVTVACFGIQRGPWALPRRLLWPALVLLQWPVLRHANMDQSYAQHEGRWNLIGRQLASSFPASTTLATSPIGAIGYRSKLPVIDLLGLTHRGFIEAAPDLSIRLKGHHRYQADWVLEKAPEVVVLGNGAIQLESHTLFLNPWERTLFEHPRFQSSYRPVLLEVEDSYPLLLYLHRSKHSPLGSDPVDTRKIF